MERAVRIHRCAPSFVAALCAVAATLVAPPSALATNEVLLIGEPPADAAGLTRLWTQLETRFGFSEVRIATAASPHEIGEQVRAFLGAPGSPSDLRLVWIAAPAASAADHVCPGWSEDYVRPRVPAILVAPACVKFLVQAPSIYEPLAAADDAAPPPGPPGVVFVSTQGDPGDEPAELVAALSGPAAAPADEPVSRALVAALACAAKSKASLDFSPSSSAWHLVPPLCDDARAATDPEATETSPADIEDATAAPAADDPAAPAVADAPLPMPPPPRPDMTAIADVPDMPAAPVTPVTAAPLAEPGAPSFAEPVDGGTVAAEFGSQAGGKANKGIDFEAPPGSAVKAADAGQVVYVGELPGYGQVVAIKHGSDFATVYAHTSGISVTKGQMVTKGQDIAKVDPTTNRLHFEVRRRGKPVDPRPMMASAGL